MIHLSYTLSTYTMKKQVENLSNYLKRHPSIIALDERGVSHHGQKPEQSNLVVLSHLIFCVELVL